MKTSCHTILEDKSLDPCDYRAAIDSLGQEKISIWIDVQGANKEELEQIMGDLHVQGLIRRFSLDSRDHPGYYPFRPLSLLVMPVITDTKDNRKMEYLGVLFGSGVLLTFYEKEFSRFQKDIDPEGFASVLPDNSISGIISSFLLGLSMVLLKRTAFISESILQLEKKMDAQPGEINMEEIADLQSGILLLESIVQGQLPVFTAFAASDKSSESGEKTKEYQTLSSANLQSADRTLELLERRLNAVRSFYDAQAREKTNRRLERLTIMSTIFMPITFLAGIWGMNFHYIPLINNPFGYAYAIVAMILISAGMYFYFRSKGWFD
ncbi:magnesium transporter CorA family protein [Aquiflexum sp. TKW24L]|uniref:magnesium transporter CorA family protein n=1 Tax=Aquiflexum sp. TKW24L TaxID=2942212 RepID=UPI0020C158BC|nr:magnesium transporter CorA family protein [Aquiflexum sp. TKW24L]MCL6258329.1 magnesium transporter CorA family protein [Aquiflexum sp. TKW24L]